MNDNSTTGEWTVELIEGWIRLNPTTWKSVLAFEHNAALAAAEKSRTRLQQAVMNGQRLSDALDSNDRLQSQLAAAVEALKQAREYIWDFGYFPIIREIDAALAKLEEGK